MTTPTPRTDALVFCGELNERAASYHAILETELTIKTAELEDTRRVGKETQRDLEGQRYANSVLEALIKHQTEASLLIVKKLRETRAAAFEEVAALDAEINRSFVYVSDIKRRAAAIRKGEV